MIRVLQKTGVRTARFLVSALTWHETDRQNGLVAWALVAGAIWLVVSVPDDSAWPRTLGAGLYLLFVLAAVCAIDARFGIIPDSLNIALAVGGLAEQAFAGEPMPFEAMIEALVVLLGGLGFRLGYRKLRGYDGLGFGDVKFLAASAFWIGMAEIPAAVLIAVISALAALWMLRAERYEIGGRPAIPFGPHLAVGVWLTWVIGPLQLS